MSEWYEKIMKTPPLQCARCGAGAGTEDLTKEGVCKSKDACLIRQTQKKYRR